ncbi:carboxynorspermidine dehydrogenase [Pseudarcicella hirudinis]|uniref:Carboxynorspermidine dehydrogenase n=1 Tax=Pseudarcicella hirudinis TaxID=1079859 RepID=A0A1I5MHW1_9BACT|nr:saccharopine dehydrogenase family protein [Pseudarcicella hirudinis]SFP09083.1 carboxynorspermidine dehydrogenase [Pseudarcicella hirudinis]
MSKKVLIIGAGGVGNVVVKKCAMNPSVFSEVLLASRTKSKCDAIAKECESIGLPTKVQTAQVDADNVAELAKLIESFKPFMVINVALPYQDLPIMDACLQTGVHYLDTANYEPKDEAKFEYSWQWAYKERFEKAGLMALLGCGFDPGVTGVYTAYANKHYFDEMHYLDIIDCNAGDHGKAFATNFNPEINIREITQDGKYWENGEWVVIPPMSIHKAIDYPNIGPKESYLLYHEELESLTKNFPTLKRARFWMTFGQQYITHLNVLQNVGMTSIQPIRFQGIDIVPLEFLKAVLPEPGTLGENYSGETSIGCQIKGIKDGVEKTYYVWNNCKHQDCWREVQAQGVSYTTGVPAMIGAMMMITGEWMKPGVWNVEEFNPDPFMEMLNIHGLPWNEEVDGVLPHEY